MSNLIKKKVGPKKLPTKERLIEILMEYTGHYGATPELIKATVEKMYPSDKTKFVAWYGNTSFASGVSIAIGTLEVCRQGSGTVLYDFDKYLR